MNPGAGWWFWHRVGHGRLAAARLLLAEAATSWWCLPANQSRPSSTPSSRLRSAAACIPAIRPSLTPSSAFFFERGLRRAAFGGDALAQYINGVGGLFGELCSAEYGLYGQRASSVGR